MPKKKIIKKDKKAKKPILIIEDEPIIAMMYVRAFSLGLYRVLVAKNYEEALSLFEKLLPKTVLLDLLLPQAGQVEPDYAGEPAGFLLLRKIKEHPEGGKTKVIVITNLAEEIHRKKAIELGADYYFVKAQIEPDELVKKVDGLSK